MGAERLAKYGRTDTGIKYNCLKNPCQSTSDPIVDLDECLKYKHCYVSPGKQCLTKAELNVKKPNEKNVGDDLKKLLLEKNETDDQVNGVNGRFFNQGSTNPFGPQGLNFMSQNCNPFPLGCNINPNNPLSVLEAIRPPVDIPYCQRIACNPSQPVFELDRTACLKNPGCYYDDELATLRSFLGEQVMPGVPACQLVVAAQSSVTWKVAAGVTPGAAIAAGAAAGAAAWPSAPHSSFAGATKSALLATVWLSAAPC